MKSIVDIFTELGARLGQIPQGVVRQAVEQNGWFCHVDTAMEALCSQMLDRAKLEQWLSAYDILPHTPKRVAIIMAGNIPAVGFADLLYVVASGNIPVVKYSAKDRVLMNYIVEQLQSIEPQLVIEQYNEHSQVDAVIATGSDSATLHFRSIFGDIPALIRGSRHSVAVLTGSESEQDMAALSADIFTHCGLGCRNVSLIFAPHDFELNLRVPDMPQGYKNNYRHARALMSLQGRTFTDCGGALIVESGAEFPRSISCINICRYSDLQQVYSWIADNRNRIQCVVSDGKSVPNSVKFGQAQIPALNDYADDVDVMKFLLSLQ
ncbi:MAG: aldehyde dehydrogenase [Alistipes sp.]|nr:aldehyde dehydrogenase [Alistipes sp.]